MNIYTLIQSALDVIEDDNTSTGKEVAGYLYTMMDNISEISSNNNLKLEGYTKVDAPTKEMLDSIQKIVDNVDRTNLIDENTFVLECLKEYKKEAQLDRLASTKEREQVRQLAIDSYKKIKKEIRLAKKQQEEELNKEDSDMENKEVPVKENKELKTESKSINEEYKDFCNDLGIDENKESSKTKFLNSYSRNYVKINGLKNVSEELKRIKEELNKDLEESKLTESKETVLASITPEIENNFNKLKEIIDSKENKVEVDGYYFTGRAVEILKNTDKEINLNSYMNLTVFDILNMIEDNDTVQEVVEELYEDYKEDSADTWANNFIEVMDKLNFDTTEEEELYEDKKLTPEDEAHYEEENDKLARQEVEDMLKNDKKEPDEEIEKELDNIKEDKELSPNMDNVEVYVNKNQFGYTTIGILVDDVNMRYALVDGQTLPIGKYKNLPKSKIRAMADELDAKGYEKIKMYGSLEESVDSEDDVFEDIYTFTDLWSKVDELYDIGEIEDDEYDNITDMINKQREAYEDYMERREAVTNTDYEDMIGIEEDYVKATIDKIKGKEKQEENKEVKTEAQGLGVDWGYYNKFEDINNKYLPDSGDGETLASQVVTAINKLVYKWYNDGDVYDNVNSKMEGWANDLSDYANWLAQNIDGAKDILDKIFDLGYGDSNGYEIILKELADEYLDEQFLNTLREQPKEGSVYDCSGPYEFKEYEEDEEEYYESKKVTESNTIVNDKNIDAIKDNFTPPGASKKTEAEEDDKRDEEIFNKMKEEPEEKTLLDMLQDRVGQKISVGEINSVLQRLFAKYTTIFIKTSELYNYEPDEDIELVIWDDEDMYTIIYHVVDLEYKTIEITDVTLD